MTNEEMQRVSRRIYLGLDMISEKAEEIGRAKDKWSIEALGAMADIEKDIAKSFMCLVNTHVTLNKNSIDEY